MGTINSEMHILDDTLHKRDDHQKKFNAFTGELQKDHRNLKEMSASMEREVNDLLSWQRAAANKIDTHSREHSRPQSALRQKAAVNKIDNHSLEHERPHSALQQ